MNNLTKARHAAAVADEPGRYDFGSVCATIIPPQPHEPRYVVLLRGDPERHAFASFAAAFDFACGLAP